MTLSDPSRLLTAATGFMARQALLESRRNGLFAALTEGLAGPEAFAAAIGRRLRTRRILAVAMATQGLLDMAPQG